MNLFRQGDVLIREVSSIPKAAKPIERDAGRIVLAYGEQTGHAHAIVSDAARFVVNEATMQRFLDVSSPVELRHEEHSKIDLPPGQYEIVIQREYEPGAIRNVAD